MEVTRFQQPAYIRIAVFRGGNAMEYYNEFDLTLCLFDLIPKIKELIRGRWFATREDIANAMRQQVTRLTYGVPNAESGGIQCLPHRWQRVVIVAGDYIEGLWAQV
ncbi:uncharacterized protein TNCV_4912931 [Trichonephila clavipes]|nr:uncharacterized protein TNCV_4912931 [Trichonephila clavipes]